MSETQAATAVPVSEADDVINQLAGITASSPLGQLRAQRPEVFRYAQGSYLSLLEPEDAGNVSGVERDLIALRVAFLTGSSALANWHQTRLRHAGVDEALIQAVAHNPQADLFSARQRAILAHVDLLTKAPATATAAHIAALSAVGLQPRDIVTISQLISFLSFQVRTLVGLRILAEEV